MHWEVYKGSSARLPGRPRVRFSRSELVWRGAQCTEKSVSHFYCLLNDQRFKIFKVKVLVVQSCVTLWDPWTVVHQAPLSMGFSRKGYWSGLPFPSPGELPDPGIEPRSPELRADSLPSEPPGSLVGDKSQKVIIF